MFLLLKQNNKTFFWVKLFSKSMSWLSSSLQHILFHFGHLYNIIFKSISVQNEMKYAVDWKLTKTWTLKIS